MRATRPDSQMTMSTSRGSRRRLISAAGIYTAGTFAHKGATFLLLPMYARLFIVEDYARWSLFLGLSTLLSAGFELAWSRSVPRMFYEHWHDEPTARGYLLATFLQQLLLITVGVTTFLTLGGGGLERITAGKLSHESFAAPLALAAAAEAILLFVCASYRARQLPVPFVSLKIAQVVAQVFGVLVALCLFSDSVGSAALGFGIGAFSVAVIATACLLRYLLSGRRTRPRCLGSFLSNARFSVPLVLSDYASWLRNAADPYIIAQFLSLYYVSVYHVGYQFGLLISLFLYSIDLALAPFLYEMMKTDRGFRAKYLDISRATVGTTLALVVSVTLFSREIVTVAFPPDMAEAARIAPLITAAYFFHGLYSVYLRAFTFSGRTAWIPVLTLGPTLAGIGLTIIVTPAFGIVGPAVVTMVSLALLAGVVYCAAQRVERFDYPIGLHSVCAAIAIATGVFASSVWDAPVWASLFGKATLWLVIMALVWRVFVVGRERNLFGMITIDLSHTNSAEPMSQPGTWDGGKP